MFGKNDKKFPDIGKSRGVWCSLDLLRNDISYQLRKGFGILSFYPTSCLQILIFNFYEKHSCYKSTTPDEAGSSPEKPLILSHVRLEMVHSCKPKGWSFWKRQREPARANRVSSEKQGQIMSRNELRMSRPAPRPKAAFTGHHAV